MGQGQGPPEQPGATHSPQGEHGEDCEDGRSAPLTLTQPDPAQRLGDDHPSGAKRAPEGAAPCPPARRREREGETLALTSNFGPSGPSEIPSEGASVFGYQKHSLLPA